jgi:hypothetical protein
MLTDPFIRYIGFVAIAWVLIVIGLCLWSTKKPD